ncbi:MAG: formyl transferase [Candidatus Limnocylindria bacterium]
MSGTDDQVLVQPAQGLVLVTTGTSHAAGILAALERHGLRPHAVLLERPVGSALVARIRDSRRRRGWGPTVLALARHVRARIRPADEPWRTRAFYEARAGRVVTVPRLTGAEAVAALRSLQPRVVLLGGAPILPAELLEIASLGTLNAHPGLLPAYRGVDVVPWAVLNGDPVGTTVHFVDAGIDTGGIVSRTPVDLRPGEDLAKLQARVEGVGGERLADAASELLERGSLPTETVAGRHPLRRRMTGDQRRAAEARLRAAR